MLLFNRRFWIVASAVLIAVTTGAAHAQSGWVLSYQKISYGEGGFTGSRSNDDMFGWSVASLGDLDGDGVGDLAVGAPNDNDGRGRRGAVWVLFLNTDGTVKSHQKISDTEDSLTVNIDFPGEFGWSVASLGDLDGDGVGDLAVGRPVNIDGNDARGAVSVLFLNKNGTVKTHQKINHTEGGFTGILDDGDWFGSSVVSLGDLDADGVDDLVVGASGDDDGGVDRGAVWVLLLNRNGTVKSHQKISDTEGGFTGILDHDAHLGMRLAAPGDLDGDGVGDLYAYEWVLFLERNGTVKSHRKIDKWWVLAPLGDLDGDGVGDLAAVHKPRGDDRGLSILCLNVDGTVKSHEKISDTEGGLTGILDSWLVRSLASVGDLDRDGVSDLVVGGKDVDTGGSAVWVLFLKKADGAP